MAGLLGRGGGLFIIIGIIGMVCLLCLVASVNGIGANWGTQASHPLPPDTVVQLLKDNGIQKVKLFDADEGSMNALKKSGIEVMVGIPNDMLATLASGMNAAEQWVSNNVSSYVNDGVNIRYVAVGNEPFLKTYNGSFLATTFPALQNIQSSLIKAGLSSQIKVTIPLNADVYESSTNLPSGGDFRSDISDLMLSIVKFFSDNALPFTVNIYPFISLYNDPHFPFEFAFFDGTSAAVIDGGVQYSNVFDANLDTLLWALKKNGYGNLPIIVGEIGWPTDGDMNANLRFAQRFNQGLMSHILNGSGTPMRSGPVNAYLFSLIDEDEKSNQPGNFERHWGIFYNDGMPKYQLNLLGSTTNTGGLVRARNVKYLERKWCVLKSSVSLDDPRLVPSVSYACGNADCTSLGYMTSCSNLNTQGNISYAFNSYYQKNYQDDIACKFSGLATVTKTDPSTGTCKFAIMIDETSAGTRWKLSGKDRFHLIIVYTFIIPFVLLLLLLALL